MQNNGTQLLVGVRFADPYFFFLFLITMSNSSISESFSKNNILWPVLILININQMLLVSFLAFVAFNNFHI